MEGKDAIIAEIIGKAEKAADGLILQARAEKDAELERVRSEEKRKSEKAVSEALSAAETLKNRRSSLAELEARKILLAAKQDAINKAFDEAVRKFLNMTDHIYREFIADFIIKYAEEGDKLIIAESDERRLHSEWLNSVNKQCGKNVTFADKRHNGKGGIILSGKICDKNFTLETMLAAVKEKYFTAVAERLFKQVN